MVTGQDTQLASLGGQIQPRETMLVADDAGQPAEVKQKALDISPIIRIIQRNILLIGSAAVVVAGLQTYLSIISPQVYAGSFQILVEPITREGRSVDPSVISRDRLPDLTDTLDYATLLQVLQSPEILSKIAADIRKGDPTSKVTADSLQRDLAKGILVIRRLQPPTAGPNGTKVLEVVYQGSNSQKVQFVLEKFKDGLLRYSLEDRKTRIGGGIQFIEDQLPALQQRVNALEAGLQGLRQRYRLTDPKVEAEAMTKQVQDIRSQRFQVQRDLAEQSTLYNRLQTQLELAPDEAVASSALSENPRYQDLLSTLQKVETQIAVRSARYVVDINNPVMQGLLDQKKNLEALLQKEAQANLGRDFSGISQDSKVFSFQNSIRLALIKQLVDAANTIQVLQVRNQVVTQTESFLDSRLREFPGIVRQYNDFQQQLEIATRTLNQFLSQRETLRIEAAQKEIPWEVISAPSLTKDAAGNVLPAPRGTMKKLMMGLVGGLVVGSILALLREKQKNLFLSSADVPGALDSPFLGVVPFQKGVQAAPVVPTVASTDPFAKGFNSIYTMLRFLLPNLRSVVVGSAGAGDGKTTVALHLAIVTAAMGQRVLLVDSNLRSPQLHTILDLPNEEGLVDLLQGRAPLEQVMQRSSSLSVPISVITAGQVAPDSAKLLASAELRHLMHQLHTGFDLVIYDSPDLTEFADTNFLATQTNGILMVVGVKQTKRSALKQVINGLKRFRLPVVGVVANHPPQSKPSSLLELEQLQVPEHEAQRQSALLQSLGVLKR
jgi:capsular exopolysaccharide synthesis family protein